MSDQQPDGVSAPAMGDAQARAAYALLAEFNGAGRPMRVEDVLKAAATLDATEPVDLAVNAAKLVGGVSILTIALMMLRQREQGAPPDDTLAALKQFLGPEAQA